MLILRVTLPHLLVDCCLLHIVHDTILPDGVWYLLAVMPACHLQIQLCVQTLPQLLRHLRVILVLQYLCSAGRHIL